MSSAGLNFQRKKERSAECEACPFPEFALSTLRLMLTEGLSQAGNQEGLSDPRTSLVKTAFKTYDDLPEGL